MFMLAIENLIPPETLDEMRGLLAQSQFGDGRRTAGFSARLVKNNAQLNRDDPHTPELTKKVEAALQSSQMFNRAVRPRRTVVMFNRYEGGQSYGSHLDDSYMRGMRTDVSFTIFLNDPETYAGGELVIEKAHGEVPIKLKAGNAIVYPSNTLHRVEPVTQGVRLCAVGWVQSFIRDDSKREMLFDLDNARLAMFEQNGKSREFDLVSKTIANLIRLWGDG
ncbi:MAG TPA: Fe2+-dependent dioxygenase [Micropepsaceae bacterium]|nr:Fe2+-dependent dioxygenase [Micropepsaceae bacterium]HRK72552.1 Fe2+-dependent dioxygenase [Micropepsaceae bacterium]